MPREVVEVKLKRMNNSQEQQAGLQGKRSPLSGSGQFGPLRSLMPLANSNPEPSFPKLEESSTFILPVVELSPNRQSASISSTPLNAVASTPQGKIAPGRRSARKKRRFLLFAALSLLLLLAMAGAAILHFALKGTPDVTLYRVSMKSVSQDIGGGGIAYPVQRLDISYPFASHVLAVYVKPGDRVRPNQSLVQIDLSQVNAQNIAQLQVQVNQAYSDMQAALAYLNSVSRTGNPVVIAQAQQQYTTAQARYNALVAEEQAPSLHQGNILSTINGIVTAVNAYPGELLSADRIMLTIYDESRIIIRTKIPLSNYGQVQINQAVQVTPSALPDQTYPGKVTSIIPNADPQSGTFEVWITVANTRGNLLPGMNTFVSIQNTLTALVVPRLAVLNPDRDSIVFVVQQQHVHIRHVQITGYSGDVLLIGSGLQPGDLIALVGLDSLQDGEVVHVAGIES